MNTPASVLGVLALNRVVLTNPTQLKAAWLLDISFGVLGVLGLTRARMCAYIF